MEETGPADEGAEAPFDVFLSYCDQNERLARALQGELHRLRPGTRIWCQKGELGAGDALSQSLDEALSAARMVMVLWTPERLAAQAALEEARRALNLQKPAINLMVDLAKPDLPAAFAHLPSFEIGQIARLAGRSGGWLPPSQPGRDDIHRELRPVLEAVEETLADTPAPDTPLADTLIGNLLTVAGEAHEPGFDATVQALGRSDRVSAVETMLIADYEAEEINRVIAPYRLVLADREGERPAWGAWRLEAPDRPPGETRREAWPLALAGFLGAGLIAACAWLLASMLGGAPGGGDNLNASLAACTVEPDGAVTGAACRLEHDVPARPAAVLTRCTPSPQGAISNVPCRLEAPLRPSEPMREAAAGDAPDPLEACTIRSNGDILNTPCRLEAAYRSLAAPSPARTPLPTCARAPSGAITDVPCRVTAALPALDRPRPASLPACRRAANGAIRNAPCEVEAALGPIAPQREEIAACATPRPGRALSADCRLPRAVTVAHAPCNSNFSNLPCTLERAPQPARAEGASQPAAPAPPRDLPPIEVPDNPEPCEVKREAPCRLSVSRTGLNTLSEIAQFYYGVPAGYCRIFRGNPDVFGTRTDPRTPSNPNCIFIDDEFTIPAPPADGVFSTAGCPPPRAQTLCLRQ